jgi:hypothetical protein
VNDATIDLHAPEQEYPVLTRNIRNRRTRRRMERHTDIPLVRTRARIVDVKQAVLHPKVQPSRIPGEVQVAIVLA